MKFTPKQIKESKLKALEKIKEILNHETDGFIDELFNERTGDYYSKDKFIISYNSNWKGIPSEFSIDKSVEFYKKISGYGAVYCTRSLFHEKQITGYATIERALIEVGLKLCSKEEKEDFFKKYALRYNKKLKKNQPNKPD